MHLAPFRLMTRMRTWCACALSLSLVSLFACGGGSKEAVGIEHATAPGRKAPKKVPSRTQRLFVTNAADRLLGPFMARGANRNLVTWVDSGENGTRRVRAMFTDDGGVPVEPVRDLVAPAGDVTSLITKRAGGNPANSIVAWTTLVERSETLTLMGIGDDGSVAAPALEVARTNEDIVWVDVVPTSRGAVAFWAEETRDGKANVLSIAVDTRGKPRGVPSYVARGVVGWEAAPLNDGVALALLNEPPRKKEGGGFLLSLVRLDDDARPQGSPVSIVPDASAQPDFELARVQGGLLFVWTDRAGLEPELKTAFVDERLRVAGIERVGSPLAGAKLLRVAPLTRGALVAYEESTQRPRASRRVHLARVSVGAERDRRRGADAETILEIEGRGPPEMVALGDGAAVMGRMRVCDRSDDDEACARAPFAPAVVELDGDLAAGRAERIEHGDPAERAELAWGLSCAPRCLALGLSGVVTRDSEKGEAPVSGQAVLAAPLFGRATSQRVVVTPLYAVGRPRPKSVATIFRTEPVSQVSVARAGGASLVAVLTRGTNDNIKAKNASASSLYVVPLDKDGKAGEAIPIATRADPAGGVSLATAADGSIALAYAQREDAGSRVRLAKLTVAGKKSSDTLVSTRKTEVAGVNVVAVEGGYVVGWVDGRDGQGEVYATKVTADLARVGEHQRLTNAPGDAGDLSMVAHPSGVVWLAWADPRENPREGSGDIYAIGVRAKDARKVGDEVRVLSSAAHSRSPSLVVANDGVAIGWIEEAPIGTEADSHAAYGAMLAWLDARGHAVREPVKLRGAGRGAPVGIVLDSSKSGARGILVRSAREELLLDAFTVDKSARADGAAKAADKARPVVTSWLLSPQGPPTLDLALAVDENAAIFAEEGRSASEHRIRRLDLDWGE